jgi:hypothetical protein
MNGIGYSERKKKSMKKKMTATQLLKLDEIARDNVIEPQNLVGSLSPIPNSQKQQTPIPMAS